MRCPAAVALKSVMSTTPDSCGLGLAVRTRDAAQYQLAAVRRRQMDVAHLDARQFAQDHLRRHRSRLGSGVASARVGLVNQRQQAGTLGQVVECFPQGIRQDADEDMCLRTAGVLVPDRTQE